MKHRKDYFNIFDFQNKALIYYQNICQASFQNYLFNTLVLNTQDLLGVEWQERGGSRPTTLGRGPVSLHPDGGHSGETQAHDGSQGQLSGRCLGSREQLTTIPTIHFIVKQKTITPLRSWVFGFHTFSFGHSLLGHQQELIEKKYSQRFQLLLMWPKCFHCHSLGLQLFNKFPVIITSFWSNSS